MHQPADWDYQPVTTGLDFAITAGAANLLPDKKKTKTMLNIFETHEPTDIVQHIISRIHVCCKAHV